MSREAGKGDTYRPVNQKKWDENYDRIFAPKNKKVTHDSIDASRFPSVEPASEDR